MSEKVIFLDFDGVLSTTRSCLVFGNSTDFDSIAVRMLSNLCAATGVKIVCSSSRTNPGHKGNFQETLTLLTEAGFDPVHLHKDWSCFFDMLTPRKAHISQWLSEHPEVTHYAIIDDEAVGLPNMVRVTDADGLQAKHFDKLARILDFDMGAIFTQARHNNFTRRKQNIPGMAP